MHRLTVGLLLLSFAIGTPTAQPQVSPAIQSKPAHAEKPRVVGIRNFGKVTDQLYRGAQPRAGSLRRLKEFGITTLVDLRGEDSGRRNRERKEAEALGIHFVSIPVGGWSAPNSDQVAQFLSLFGAGPKEKVFIHCRLGEDRTGVFVATYRIAVQKWPMEQALQEMYFFGFNGFWHPALISFVRNFPGLLSSSPTLAAFGKSASSMSAVAQPN